MWETKKTLLKRNFVLSVVFVPLFNKTQTFFKLCAFYIKEVKTRTDFLKKTKTFVFI